MIVAVIKLGTASYNFFDTSTSEFPTSALLKHRITKQYFKEYQ